MTAASFKAYCFVLRTFRNWFAVVQNLRNGSYLSGGPALDRLIFRNGLTVLHPPKRGGLAVIGLELWHNNVYRIGEFYVPKPGDIVVDVGAHVGLFTLRILCEEARCRVIALEPYEENFTCLIHNLADSGMNGDVTAHQLGIGAGFGRISMNEPQTNRSFDARAVPATETDLDAGESVPLAHLLKLAEADHISFLKMDAEGGEFAAFSTADVSTIMRIERLAMEYHDNLAPGTLSLLREKLSSSHQVTVLPDRGQLHGRLFAVRKDLVRTTSSASLEAVPFPAVPCYTSANPGLNPLNSQESTNRIAG